MKNKFGAFGSRKFSLETLVGGRPGTTIFQNPGGGGGGGGGGWGGVAYKDRARPPPRAFTAKIKKLHDLTAKKQLPILLKMHACWRCAHLWPRSGR